MSAGMSRPAVRMIPRSARCQLRRSRFTFAVTRLCHGASSDAGDVHPSPAAARCAVILAAACFSRTIRLYSAGEQAPVAIIATRRLMTSNEARPISASIFGT